MGKRDHQRRKEFEEEDDAFRVLKAINRCEILDVSEIPFPLRKYLNMKEVEKALVKNRAYERERLAILDQWYAEAPVRFRVCGHILEAHEAAHYYWHTSPAEILALSCGPCVRAQRLKFN